MKKTVMMAAVAMAGYLCSYAQPTGGPPRGAMPIDPIVQALDVDTNSVISATEISNASTRLLTLDKNSDGKLAADELKPSSTNRGTPPSDGRPAFVRPVLKALDADSDGTLSQDEITKAAAALKTLDKNSDGQLTRDELMPQRPGGGGGGGRGAGRTQQG